MDPAKNLQLYDFDQQAKLDYTIDFDALGWLPGVDAISTYSLAPDDGLIAYNDSLHESSTGKVDGAVTFWVRCDDPAPSINQRLKVRCHILTVQGREDDRTVYYEISAR